MLGVKYDNKRKSYETLKLRKWRTKFLSILSMKLFLTLIALLLIIPSFYGQKHLEGCPKFSTTVDSVSIQNTKFENNLRKRVQKYNPKEKIVRLWFNYNYKKKDSVLNLTLFNKTTYSFYHLIEHHKIYGYFTIDSVLFVIENENVPQYLFLLSENSKILDTDEVDCLAITLGQLTGIECTYIIKTKRNRLKIRKQSAFLLKTKQMIVYNFYRVINLFRKNEVL